MAGLREQRPSAVRHSAKLIPGDFMLSRVTIAIEELSNLPGPEADLPKPQVLVVEDEWMIASLLEQLLERLGYGVTGTAPNVRTAIALLDRAPDLALLDIQLGRETSYPIAEALAERGIPFAFVTAYGAQGLPDRFSGRAVLGKPFSERALEALLDRLHREGRSGPAPGEAE